jgi:hypothetical protein
MRSTMPSTSANGQPAPVVTPLAVRHSSRQRELIDELERNQEGNDWTRLDFDFHWKSLNWVRDLDVEAPGIREKLDEWHTHLKTQGLEELAHYVGLLAHKVFRIEVGRGLMELEKKLTYMEQKD